MKIGDIVRTRQAQPAYNYERPICVIVEMNGRSDGVYCEIIDPAGDIKRWCHHRCLCGGGQKSWRW